MARSFKSCAAWQVVALCVVAKIIVSALGRPLAAAGSTWALETFQLVALLSRLAPWSRARPTLSATSWSTFCRMPWTRCLRAGPPTRTGQRPRTRGRGWRAAHTAPFAPSPLRRTAISAEPDDASVPRSRRARRAFPRVRVEHVAANLACRLLAQGARARVAGNFFSPRPRAAPAPEPAPTSALVKNDWAHTLLAKEMASTRPAAPADVSSDCRAQVRRFRSHAA